MTSAVLAGSTGLVGSNIFQILGAHPSVAVLHAYTRRELPNSPPKVKPLLSSDSSTWSSQYPENAPLFISALGTTRAQAGSADAQYKIDFGLNLELAKAAKKAGATTYVLISSQGANSKSFFAYPRMKGELEDAVKDLGFEHTVIVRPGLIVGPRNDARPPEFVLQKIAGLAGSISTPWLKDGWAQNADVIAKAAVNAGLQCVEGKVTQKVWLLSMSDVVRYGRTEWQESVQ